VSDTSSRDTKGQKFSNNNNNNCNCKAKEGKNEAILATGHRNLYAHEILRLHIF
jgi:hypothetical protein